MEKEKNNETNWLNDTQDLELNLRNAFEKEDDLEIEKAKDDYVSAISKLPSNDFFKYQEDLTQRVETLLEEGEIEKLQAYKSVIHVITPVALGRSYAF